MNTGNKPYQPTFSNHYENSQQMRITTLILILFSCNLIGESQDITTKKISTSDIKNYFLLKGGDSTINKYNCDYIVLIDTQACLSILKTFEGGYKTIPLYSKKESIDDKNYRTNYYTYKRFVTTSGLYLKNEKILKILMELQFAVLNDTLDKYITQVLYSDLNALIFQIDNSENNNLLVNLADKWSDRAQRYDYKRFSSFGKNIAVFLTGDYPIIVENYIRCKENERLFLLAQNALSKNKIDSITLRIKDIGKELYEITKFSGYLNSDRNEFDQDSDSIGISHTIILKHRISNLVDIDLTELISEYERNSENSLTLIYNGNKGILEKSNSNVNKRHGYANYLIYFIDWTNYDKLQLTVLTREYIN
jgi:hypothetical protein